VVQLAREAIGLAMATEEQHSRMHRNGVRSSGVYSVEGTLNKQQHEDLAKWLQREMAGVENASKPMILDRNAKWLSTAMTGVDAQHLETRKYQVEDVCRFMRVMPIMVGYSDKAATYASAEQMFLAHVVHTLAPWYQRLEQSIDANLLTKAEREDGYYAQFVEEGLLRGSIEATAIVLDKYVNGGLMTPNEGRAKLDMNPDPDPASNKLRVPANIVGKQPQGEPK
jgi:HK97 family phage portal protein